MIPYLACIWSGGFLVTLVSLYLDGIPEDWTHRRTQRLLELGAAVCWPVYWGWLAWILRRNGL